MNEIIFPIDSDNDNTIWIQNDWYFFSIFLCIRWTFPLLTGFVWHAHAIQFVLYLTIMLVREMYSYLHLEYLHLDRRIDRIPLIVSLECRCYTQINNSISLQTVYKLAPAILISFMGWVIGCKIIDKLYQYLFSIFFEIISYYLSRL